MASPPTTDGALPPTENARWTLLSTRVGRRVFLLFVLSALIPVLGMGVVSYRNVAGHIRTLSEQRVSGTAKAAGMAFIERLMAADGQLQDWMDGGVEADLNRVSGPTVHDHPGDRMNPGRFLRRVAAVPWERRRELLGTDAAEGKVASRLALGEPQLVVHPEGRDAVVLRLVRLDSGKNTVYGADLVLDSVLAASRIYAETQYGAGICLLTGSGVRLSCDPAIESSFASASRPEELTRRGIWLWEAGGRDYLGGYWTAFLSASFGADPLVLAVAEGGDGLRVPAQAFSSAFLLAVALCMAVVLASSTLLIRRNLSPLERLKDAAQSLGRGQYETRLEIDSGDEFEELAGAFNGMARRLVDQIEELHELHVATIRALSRAIDASSHWTRGHSERVAELSVAIGGEMGLSAVDLELIYRGGLLHDVGKIGVPTHILDKAASLTDEEFDLVRAHPVIGIRILEPVAQLAPLLPMVRSHHERMDGQGYPDGLTGGATHPFARIMAVADVWDAITSDRPYREAMSFDRAWEIIALGAGTHFDPQVVAAFETISRDWYRRPAASGFEPADYARFVREGEHAHDLLPA
ncbi:MAG: HD domain-containing protein [Gemmatimonadetes bacterium]|nr:HD domain-containing protein [Gemmatimonadota bacterium]